MTRIPARFSFVIPACNEEKYVPWLLDSLDLVREGYQSSQSARDSDRMIF